MEKIVHNADGSLVNDIPLYKVVGTRVRYISKAHKKVVWVYGVVTEKSAARHEDPLWQREIFRLKIPVFAEWTPGQVSYMPASQVQMEVIRDGEIGSQAKWVPCA